MVRTFQIVLSIKGNIQLQSPLQSTTSVREYVRAVDRAPMIHRDVAKAINGLVDFLKVERRRVPDAVIHEASRLESLLFSGYDPHLEGEEPPDL